VADNVPVTPGSGATIATDQLATGEHVQFVKLMDGTLDGTSKAAVGANGLKVDGSVADGADVAQGATTDTSSANTVIGILKAIKAAVTGTLTVATHAVTQSGTWTVARSWVLSSATDSVNVGNFPASQAVTGTFFQATQPVSGTVTANQGGAPWSDNITQVGGVAVAATAKGTQGTNLIPTQDAKDAGRTAVTLFLDAVAGITTEALGTMSITKGGVAQTAATSYTVTAGKTLRISGLHTSVKNTSTVASDSRTRVRQAASSFSVSSPIVLVNEAGSPAAVANAVGTDDTVMPDGYEIAGGQIIGISHVESATTCTVSVMLVGYEY